MGGGKRESGEEVRGWVVFRAWLAFSVSVKSGFRIP